MALLVTIVSMAAWAKNQPAGIVIDYPLDGSVFGPDMDSPTFLWRDPAASAVLWCIVIRRQVFIDVDGLLNFVRLNATRK